jgi:hypothetical protein
VAQETSEDSATGPKGAQDHIFVLSPGPQIVDYSFLN